MFIKKRLILTTAILLIFSCIVIYGLRDSEPSYAFKAKGDYYRRKGPEYYALAVREYEKAIQVKKTFGICYYWISWIFTQKGLYHQALMEINEAIKYKNTLYYKSRFIDMLYLKAEILFKSLMNSEGKKVLEEIIDYLKRFRQQITDLADPIFRRKFGRAYFILGSFYRRTNTLSNKRIKNFLHAIQLGFRPDLCHYFLYEYYKAKANAAAASQHLESTKRILKQNGRNLNDLKNEIRELTWNLIWKVQNNMQ